MDTAARKTGSFHGGLRLPTHKEAATRHPIRPAAIPAAVTLPLHQHLGNPAKPVVAVGDRVLRGQPIAAPDGYVSAGVHASISGVVTAIGERPVPHPSGLSSPCIVIESDGEDRAHDGYEPLDFQPGIDPATLRNRIGDAGIVGLGGAAFPASVKLHAPPGGALEALILNGAECEPYICCDDMLMRERAADVVEGARVLMYALQVSHCIIAVENDMAEATAAMGAELDRIGDERIELVRVPARYPEGGEKQLLQVLTGKEVPADGLPPDVGYLCQNVGTAYAAARAIEHGEALISRIITVTGAGVSEPANLEVRLGTSISELVEQCGGYTDDAERLVMGGAMMGFALPSDELPAVKATNCILVASADEIRTSHAALPCIRCGECARVCPASLLPQQLYWYTRTEDFDKVEDYDLQDCIECGCCDYVCPSHIPLTHYFRFAKAEIWERERNREKSTLARRRFEHREERLAAEAAEREARRAARKQALHEGPKDPIDEIVARVKGKKSGPPENGESD